MASIYPASICRASIRRAPDVPKLLIRDLHQVVSPAGRRAPLRGAALGELELIENGYVLCNDAHIEAVGPMSELGLVDSDVEDIDGSGLLRDPGPRRLPHASCLRRRPRRGVLAPRGRRDVRGAARGRRGDSLDRSRDARGGGGGAARRGRAPPRLDAARRDDHVRGEVRVRARPRDRARVAAGDPGRRRCPDVPRRALDAARARSSGCLSRLPACGCPPGCGRACRCGRRLPRARRLRHSPVAPLSRSLRRARPRSSPPRRPVHRVGRDPARNRARRPLCRSPRGHRPRRHRRARGERRLRCAAPRECALPRTGRCRRVALSSTPALQSRLRRTSTPAAPSARACPS